MLSQSTSVIYLVNTRVKIIITHHRNNNNDNDNVNKYSKLLCEFVVVCKRKIYIKTKIIGKEKARWRRTRLIIIMSGMYYDDDVVVVVALCLWCTIMMQTSFHCILRPFFVSDFLVCFFFLSFSSSFLLFLLSFYLLLYLATIFVSDFHSLILSFLS